LQEAGLTTSQLGTGGGALLAAVDGKSIELLRYSNAQQRKFHRIAKYLNEIKDYRDRLEKSQRGEKDKSGDLVEAPKEKPTLEPDKEDQRRCPTCKLLLPEGSKVCPACMSKGKAIRRMLVYLKPHKRQIILIWITMIFGLGFSLIPVYLTRPLTDQVLNPVNHPRPLEERLRLLGLLVLTLGGVQFLGQALAVWRGRMAARRPQGVNLSFLRSRPWANREVTNQVLRRLVAPGSPGEASSPGWWALAR